MRRTTSIWKSFSADVSAPLGAVDPVFRQLHRKLAGEPLLQPLLNSFPGPALIMNQRRQAVLVNAKLAALLNMPAIELLGLRPGEMLDCVR